MDLLKQRIGHTVLYRAGKINRNIGSGELFLKMEGLNPTGHMHDRVAYYLAMEASQLGHDTLAVASLGQLGASLAHISTYFGLKCRVFMPEGSSDSKKRWFRDESVEVIEFGKSYNEAYYKCRELSRANGWYDANHGYSNSCITDTVYSEIAEEIAEKLGKSPDNVFCFLSNGALITGLHLGFRSLWRRGKIERIPKIFAACAGEDNPVFKAFEKGETRIPLDRNLNRYRGLNKNAIEYNILDPQNVLNAIYDSGGKVVSVNSGEIRSVINEARSLENLNIAFRGAAAIAACFKVVSETSDSAAQNSVVILEEGRNELRIDQLNKVEHKNLESLAAYVEKFLGSYGDDRESVLEAIETAFESGFVLGAYIGGSIRGIAVVIKMPVKKVMPQYHLVYIGADISAGSRGIGTRLMETVRNLTGGSFSLHVDVENKKAIRLYEKMGLKKCYFRMIAGNQPEV